MDLVERTRELLNAWNEGGPDALEPFARDDVVLIGREDVLERDTIFGKAAVIDRFRDRLALDGKSRVVARSVDRLDEQRVIAEMDQLVHLYTWDDGLLARIEEFSDVTSARGLVGAWELVEWRPRGDSVGWLIYSEQGVMSALLAGSDGFSDAIAYAGTWELRGGEEVVHHVAVSTRESFVGRDLVRRVSWADGDLVLTTPPTRDGVVNVLRWRRGGA